MTLNCDALVVGGGPAGSAVAIFLALAGWQVVLAEQHTFPRRKVCGECVAAGNLALLDRLGVGLAFREAAGAELSRVGWMAGADTMIADMPRCSSGPYPYGRAFGRDRLDTLLLLRARSLGVTILQPATVCNVLGVTGNFDCAVRKDDELLQVRAPVLVDAHGSWDRRRNGLAMDGEERRAVGQRGDLFAFKAVYRSSSLVRGFLPVLALRGGYGGMVVAEDGRTTLACCIRRDRLASCRALTPEASAGTAIETFLRRSSAGVDAALRPAEREGAWLAVGPLRPGIRVSASDQAFRVGNSAGESHPLIGEGISMALQGSALLAQTLAPHRPNDIEGSLGRDLHRSYANAWRRTFAPRLRIASAFAQIAMNPQLADPARVLLRWWPSLLGAGARLAGKAASAADPC